MSPILRFFCDQYHFFFKVKLGTHSHIHLRQKCLVSYWNLLQHFLRLPLTSSSAPGVNLPPIYPCRKWFGVKGISSYGFADWYVKGLEFIKDSTPVKAVISSSSLTTALPRMAKMGLFATLIIDSKTPYQNEELMVG